MFYVILCEGKTDSVVISHVMSSVGFEYTNKKNKLAKFKLLKNQSVDYFENNNDILAIWNVAGYNNIKSSVEEIIKLNKVNKVVDILSIVVDRDFDNIFEIEDEISAYFEGNTKLENKIWKEYQFTDGFGEIRQLKILLTIVPDKDFGTMETILLNALSDEGEDQKNLVNDVEKFIVELEEKENIYLNKKRNVIKAKLGCTVNIMDPERTFSDIIPVFKNIAWNEKSVVQEHFKELKEYK